MEAYELIFEEIPRRIEGVIKGTISKYKDYKEKSDELDKGTTILSTSLSDEIVGRIKHVAKDNEIRYTILLKSAIDSERLVQYFMYLMVDDNAKVIKAGDKEKRFLNTLSNLIGIGNIFDDGEVGDIHDYEITYTHAPKWNYVIIPSEVIDKLSDPNFIEAWHAKMARLGMGYNPNIIGLPGSGYATRGRVGEDGLFYPVFISDEPLEREPKYDQNIPQDVIYRFENTIGKLFGDNDQYRYKLGTDNNYYLYITRANTYGAEEQYLIDDGRIMGGSKVSVLANSHINGQQVSMFVDVVQFPDIAYNVLRSVFYELSPEEMNIVRTMYFSNPAVYYNIDLSNTKFLDVLSFPERCILDANLSKILNYIIGSSNVRYRFYIYNSPESFELISDSMCQSTVLGMTAQEIEEGSRIIVTPTNIQKLIGGHPVMVI